MEKLTFYDLNKIFERIVDSRSSNFEMDDFLDPDNAKATNLEMMVSNKFAEEVDKIGQFKLVQDNETELEGYGEITIKKVFHFTDHDIYVQFKGFWSSNGGSQFESCKEVKSITKTITVYE